MNYDKHKCACEALLKMSNLNTSNEQNQEDGRPRAN